MRHFTFMLLWLLQLYPILPFSPILSMFVICPLVLWNTPKCLLCLTSLCLYVDVFLLTYDKFVSYIVWYLYMQNLIDLAGSESSKAETTGLRRKEGAYINKSLLTLGTVSTKVICNYASIECFISWVSLSFPFQYLYKSNLFASIFPMNLLSWNSG